MRARPAMLHLILSIWCLLVMTCGSLAADTDVVILTGGDGSGKDSVEVFGHAGCNSSLTLPDDRSYHTSNYIDGKVLVCGGNNYASGTSCLQLVDGKFKAHSQLNVERMLHSGVVLNGELSLIGGSGNDASRSLETLNETSWTREGIDIGIKSSCIVTLDNSRALVTGGLLYGCVGSKGWSGGAVTMYDVDGGWTTKKSLPEWRQGHGCVVLGNGKVLVAGGFDQNGDDWPNVLNTAVVYNGDSWEQLPGELNTGRRYGQIVKLNGRILYFGGEDNEYNELDTVEEFDRDNGTWTLLEQTMKTPRKGFSAVVVPGSVVGCKP